MGGTVYLVSSSLIVPSGATLTVQPGAILKFAPGVNCDVFGTLNSNGTPAAPVIFTSLRDDSAGGDSNGDGPSAGAPGDWAQVVFRSNSDASSIANLDLRFAGAGGQAAVELNAADITIAGLRLRDVGGPGLDANGDSAPTVIASTFDSGTVAVVGLRLTAFSGFSGNSAFGNSVGDYIQPSSDVVDSNSSISADNLIGGVLVLAFNPVIGAGAELTLEEGVVVKFSGPRLIDVLGTLTCNGSAASPVVFTSLADDAILGDTGKNGQSAGAPGDWNRLLFRSISDASRLSGTEIRFAGSGGAAAIDLIAADITLENSRIEDCMGAAVDLNNGSLPTLTNCQLDDCDEAIAGCALTALAGFSSLSASGNASGDFVRVVQGSVNTPLVLRRDNLINDTLVADTSVSVATGASLTIEEGVIVKFDGARSVDAFGDFVCDGSASLPVVLTSFADDAFGGDTNGDGGSSGSPGDWGRISIRAAATGSRLSHAILRFAGSTGLPVLGLQAEVLVEDCRIEDASAAGLDLGNLRPRIERCSFRRCMTPFVNVTWEGVARLLDNESDANLQSDDLIISDPALNGEMARIECRNLPGRVMVLSGNVTVDNASTLDLGPGVVVKINGGSRIDVFGELRIRGTGLEPVIFTSASDDSFGGDSNGDGGTTQPQPGDWAGLRIRASMAPAELAHARIRYAGANGIGALEIERAMGRYFAIRVEESAAVGFHVVAPISELSNCVAFRNALDGFRFEAGSSSMLHCSSVANSGFGASSALPHNGAVSSSIFFGNGTGDLDGYSSAFVQFSMTSTFAGANGNIAGDPLFQNLFSGDLGLTANSPCIDGADPMSGLLVDIDENPRSIDSQFDGGAAPDMGAQERINYRMLVEGDARPGGVLIFRTLGPPALIAFFSGDLSGAGFVEPLGEILAGAPSRILVLGTRAPGVPLGKLVPDAAFLGGYAFGIQSVAFPNGLPFGNFSNLYRSEVAVQ